MNALDEDLALNALVQTRLLEHPSLDAELLKSCYLIQKRYQYSKESTIPVVQMEDLINGAVDSVSHGSGD